MEQETVVAAPSAAQESPEASEFDHSRGLLVDLTPEQRSEYRKTGELPKAPEPKPEAPAPSPEPAKAESEPEPEADAGEKQQEHTDKGKRKPTAEERIAQLEATIEKIRKGAGIERKAEPAPAPDQPKSQQPQVPRNYQEWEAAFEPEKWMEQFAKEHPEASYERANAAMFNHMLNVREQFRQAAEQERASMAQLSTKLDDAKARYGEKFDEVLTPTLQSIAQGVHPAIRGLLEESEVLPHVLYVIGSEEGGVEKFLAMPPGKQARAIALHEALIQEELTAKAEKAEAKVEPPAKPKTKAPLPPPEVGGRNEAPGDELESAAKAGDFRRYKAEANRRAIAALRG